MRRPRVVAEMPKEIAARLLPPPPVKKKEENLTNQLSLTPGDLTETEQMVWRLLSTDEAAHIDALAIQTNLPLGELTSALVGLEMRELIRALPGKCFVRKL